ncbi:phage tail fiber protein [Paenibacillus pabuli]|uniref:phage tail fiber protein n=1 Tax=Paenibacillus pabuli TaxID=1472 RepID=UPI001FFE77FA|nr:hypothetical protein [Paenibacillus pabuli]UPK45773.1 hypothetical protein KET34_10110 [Paenibacillus pabuli]
MNMSNYLANALLNQVFRNTAWTRPTTIYVALYTTNPTAADTGQEVSGGGYTRLPIVFGPPAIEGGKPTIKNIADIAFAIATASWGTVSHIGTRDAATGGNLLYFGPLDSPRSILANDVFKLLTGSVAHTLT